MRVPAIVPSAHEHSASTYSLTVAVDGGREPVTINPPEYPLNTWVSLGHFIQGILEELRHVIEGLDLELVLVTIGKGFS